MFRYHLKIAWRRLLKDRLFTLLNLIGLSTGLATAIFIYMWVKDERGINTFNRNDSQLYQVMNNIGTARGFMTANITPVPLAEALMKDMPEVEQAVAVNDFFNFITREGIITTGNNHVQASGWHAGKNFFRVFSYDLIEGNKDQVLAADNNIVLTETLARKLFNTTSNLIGKTLQWKHPFYEGLFTISGIVKDPPANTTARFDFLLTTGVLLKNDRWAKNWNGCYAETFLMLKKGTDIDKFNKKMAAYLHLKEPSLGNFSMFLQRYSERYLYGTYENGMPAGGRIAYVRLFSMVALFILLIACINFMNLSTAQAAGKMKEIGVKKTIGALRRSLVLQFLAESTLMAVLSLGIALVLIILLLPQFNAITGKSTQLKNATGVLLPALGIAIGTGIMAGMYPAFYLSGFKPVAVLKGKLAVSPGEIWVRKGLVIVQFSLSVIFIAGFLIIHEQIKYSQHKNLGYNKDNILCFQWKGELYNNWNGLAEGKSNAQFEAFMQELKRTPGILHATNMAGSLLNEIYRQSGASWSGQESDKEYMFQSPIVGYDFLQTLDIPLKEGRAFSKEYNDDYSKIILNESAVSMMQIKNPVGKKIEMNGTSNEIIGIVNDFHYGSLHNAIEPLIFRFDATGRNILVKIKAGTEQSTIAGLKKLYGEFLPGYAFTFSFMDDDYQALYTSELRVAALSTYFAVFAILISCLGLFGLAAFTAQKRQKEMGIRKILGATVSNLTVMLSGDFLKLVFISILIAIPVAWWAMSQWLKGFSDKVTISWWFFIVPGVMTLLVALITVSFQAIKAAVANPVKSLRTE